MTHALAHPPLDDALRSLYRDGDVLSAAALADDGAAHVAAGELHQKQAHLAGIVAGLSVWHQAKDGKIVVSPGAAIDAQGHMLLLAQEQSQPWSEAGNNPCAVWLRHSSETKPTDRSSQFCRYDDTPVVELIELEEWKRRDCETNSTGVLLAIVVIVDNKIQINLHCRRYVGAVGNRIDAASGRARIVLGPQSPQDHRRFAIGVAPQAGKPIRDAFSWDDSATIRIHTPSAVSLPPDKIKYPADVAARPPIVVVGAPSVYVTPEDIVDPCRMWDILIAGAATLKIRPEKYLPEYASLESKSKPTCRSELIALLVRLVNRMIRLPEDIATLGQQKPPAVDLHLRPSSYVTRRDLERVCNGALRPLADLPPRGIAFRESKPVDLEPVASRIHLVEIEKDGVTRRQLRITISDPGKDNQPQRYRCSIGTSDCQHPAAPVPTKKNGWNRQTSTPRGILSVLADRSVDIHDNLNVFPKNGSFWPGLLVKLAPPDDPTASDTAPPTTHVLNDVIAWDGTRIVRTTDKITLGGSLRNLTELSIGSLEFVVTLFGKNESRHGPIQIVLNGILAKKPNAVDLSKLVASSQLSVDIPQAMQGDEIIANVSVLGVNEQSAIACSQFRETLPVPKST